MTVIRRLSWGMAAKAPPRTTPPNVADAVAAMRSARAHGRGRKSAVYLWFLKNHDALVEAFALNAPAWADLAAYLGKQGLKDGNGNPPRARGTRDVWFRVRREVKQRSARETPSATPAAGKHEAAHATSPTVRDARPVNDPPMPDEQPTRRFQFGGPATLRGHTSAPPPSKPPDPVPAQAVQDVEEVVARLLGKPRNKPQPE